MEKDVILKLRDFFNKHKIMKEECHVIYLLVEIRKLLEVSRKKYPILRFYCNWAVHTSKDRNNEAILDIMKRIDFSILNEKIFPKHGISFSSDNSALEFLYFEELKNEMLNFCRDFSLPLEIFEHEPWASFRNLLVQILTDQPLNNLIPSIETVCFEHVIKGAANLVIKFKDGRGVRSFLNYYGKNQKGVPRK